jgi:hypothetical protein
MGRQCREIMGNGEQCPRQALAGSYKCATHATLFTSAGSKKKGVKKKVAKKAAKRAAK